MKDFTFCIPTKIIFGQDKTITIGKNIKKSIGDRVLLVYGSGSIHENGIYERVINSLKEAGVEWVEFKGIRSNPVLSKVKEGIELFTKENLDGVLAIGGGSVIDSAKTIAAGAQFEGDIWDCFIGKQTIKSAAPIAVVLTMAATASEMNPTAVITNEVNQAKLSITSPALYPKFSILDPINTFSAPINYSMYGAVDAISHLLEGYFNTNAFQLPIQHTMSEGLVRNIISSANVIYRRPDDYKARAEVMWAACLAFNGITIAGTGGSTYPMHMIEHSLSAIYDVPHGAGLAIIVPAWLKFNLNSMCEKIAQFSRYVFILNIEDDYDAAIEGIERLEQWFKSIGCPVRLQDVHIPVTEHEMIATNALVIAKQWGMKNYSQEVIERILMIAAAE
ncbi:MAG: iron-containing alcohol dehydrogenase [Bacteriovoracaceae bacterium]|nr:iron-containing alcohol dehydrogenase [Bacteriovoracaceae bacterium]